MSCNLTQFHFNFKHIVSSFCSCVCLLWARCQTPIVYFHLELSCNNMIHNICIHSIWQWKKNCVNVMCAEYKENIFILVRAILALNYSREKKRVTGTEIISAILMVIMVTVGWLPTLYLALWHTSILHERNEIWCMKVHSVCKIQTTRIYLSTRSKYQV